MGPAWAPKTKTRLNACVFARLASGGDRAGVVPRGLRCPSHMHSEAPVFNVRVPLLGFGAVWEFSGAPGRQP